MADARRVDGGEGGEGGGGLAAAADAVARCKREVECCNIFGAGVQTRRV